MLSAFAFKLCTSSSPIQSDNLTLLCFPPLRSSLLYFLCNFRRFPLSSVISCWQGRRCILCFLSFVPCPSAPCFPNMYLPVASSCAAGYLRSFQFPLFPLCSVRSILPHTHAPYCDFPSPVHIDGLGFSYSSSRWPRFCVPSPRHPLGFLLPLRGLYMFHCVL